MEASVQISLIAAVTIGFVVYWIVRGTAISELSDQVTEHRRALESSRDTNHQLRHAIVELRDFLNNKQGRKR